MNDTLTSANHADFRQRYRGTYGYYQGTNGSKTLVKLIEVDQQEVLFLDARGGEFRAHADSGIGFEFFAVERQVFNTPVGVLYVRRVPARQWSRGVSENNTSIVNLSKGSSRVGVTFVALDLLFNPKKTHKECFKDFLEGKITSVALSNRFSIIEGNVCMFDITIGTYSNGTININELYRQEISDLISRNNFALKVGE